LSCKVEGKANGTIDCYSDKLKGFLWYSEHYGLPTDVTAITTQHIREFLAYLRDNEHRWGSDCHRANKPVNSTTIKKYCFNHFPVPFFVLTRQGTDPD